MKISLLLTSSNTYPFTLVLYPMKTHSLDLGSSLVQLFFNVEAKHREQKVLKLR